jgi:lysophospholipase L1-like esterase
LQKVRYLAFGDSITEGYPFDLSEAYPAQLDDSLSRKYPTQTITVINEGVGGETSAQGRVRLPGVLSRRRPQVLLLLEGYNHVRYVSAGSIENDLRVMALEAQGRGIAVFLATLTPISPSKERSRPGTRAAVQNVNTRIRALAPALGVPLVDLYAIMDGRWGLFTRDVHPNKDGYRVMANAFFNQIVRRFGGPLTLSPDLLTDGESTFSFLERPSF